MGKKLVDGRKVGSGPPKLNSTVGEKITEALSYGFSLTDACKVAGVDINSIYSWQTIAESDRDDSHARNCRIFFETVEKAKLNCRLSWLKCLQEIGESKKNWLPYAWLLERNYQELYALKKDAPNQQVTVQTALQGALDHAETVLATRVVQPQIEAQPIRDADLDD